jgi:hypothetical protein
VISLVIILALILSCTNSHVLLVLPAEASLTHSNNWIAVCCAWDNTLANRGLKYMILGGDPCVRNAVVKAMSQWTSNLIGPQFTQVSEKKGADIVVTFRQPQPW